MLNYPKLNRKGDAQLSKNETGKGMLNYPKVKPERGCSTIQSETGTEQRIMIHSNFETEKTTKGMVAGHYVCIYNENEFLSTEWKYISKANYVTSGCPPGGLNVVPIRTYYWEEKYQIQFGLTIRRRNTK